MMNNKPIETELDILLQAENLLANHMVLYVRIYGKSHGGIISPKRILSSA